MAAPGTVVDYFALFDLPVAFDLDVTDLGERYLARSRLVHPDRFASAPASERTLAVRRFTQLNDAYNALRRPVSRAEYMLARAGITIGGNEQLDPGFLLEILELREELAAATAAGDEARRSALEADMRRRRDATVAGLGPAIAAGELAAAKRQLIVLRYLDRFLEAAAPVDED